MNTIVVEELEKLDRAEIVIVDIRSEEEFKRGTIDGAINLPIEEIPARIDELEKEKTIYVLCHTGEKSKGITEELTKQGFTACNVEGGYRSFLRLQLGRVLREDQGLQERTSEIERSIIKKFRKPIWRKFTKAINEYELIQEGDKIAVCISGGKDSMLMAKLLQELKKHGKIQFDLVFLIMNPGYNQDN